MSDDNTRVVPINGRDITVKAPSDAQIMLMGQQGQVAMNPKASAQDRMFAAGTLMKILVALVVDDGDREYIQDQIVIGELDMAALTSFIEAFRDKKKAPAVRRGRAAAR